ncbi:MAG TPA: isopentenyl-diphosphate Delta-isomerase [Candidatus Binatus sp.]|nr:isopentenyl-diphosphate Delta-isomerase [Candidatus Binatus sp.]
MVLVDPEDRPIGYEEKVMAHQNDGKLHRAFSIFILNSKNELLLQQRAMEKLTFAGLWSNSCCSHPLKGEELEKSIHRKLVQEFGFDVRLREVFSFTYKARDAKSGYTEHEYDHVFLGKFDGPPKPNPKEVMDWKWVSVRDLRNDMEKSPESYTPWLGIALDRLAKNAKLS